MARLPPSPDAMVTYWRPLCVYVMAVELTLDPVLNCQSVLPVSSSSAMNSPVNYWMPKTAGGDLEITPILKPLEAHRDRMTIVGNLSRAGGKTVTDHAVSSAAIPTSQLRHCYEHIDGKINQQQETVKLSPNLLPSCA